MVEQLKHHTASALHVTLLVSHAWTALLSSVKEVTATNAKGGEHDVQYVIQIVFEPGKSTRYV